MSKGLSKQQQTILRVVNDRPRGGGRLIRINKEVKDLLYPAYSYRYHTESNASHTKVRYWHKGEIVPPTEIHEHRLQIAAARASISRAINSLVKRGCLRREADDRSRIYITDQGKALLSVNEPRKVAPAATGIVNV